MVNLETQAEMAEHQPEVSVELLKTVRNVTTGQQDGSWVVIGVASEWFFPKCPNSLQSGYKT